MATEYLNNVLVKYTDNWTWSYISGRSTDRVFGTDQGFCFTLDSFLSNEVHRVESDMDGLNLV